MANPIKPVLIVEKIMGGELKWDAFPERAPHCDPRVLHKPEECKFCGDAVILQEEREKLGVSNTGHANRAWPCPADKARGSKSLNAWHGNRAATEAQLEDESKEWKKLSKDLIEKVTKLE